MELKSYQQEVLDDIEDFYTRLYETEDPSRAYAEHWNNKGFTVGQDGIRPYKQSIKGSPRICIKVPTGGGKTLIAASSISKFYDVFKRDKMSVVWLVPSDAILVQTLKNLKDPNHPYRQRLDVDFAHNVEVYNVEELLFGQNFTPTILSGQLSIYVLSFDSLRSRKKEDRRLYRPNTTMQNFCLDLRYEESPIKDADIDSVMVGLYSLSPLVIVDESHNTGSPLSHEMLENLNPSMILDMTATPLAESNVISYVTTTQLKKENMVKIPVILYGRNDYKDVIRTARDIRIELEKLAKSEEMKGGQYIRPIVLFQAQSKTKEDANTFDRVKDILVNEYGIPGEEIAIKTATVNQIKGIDLMSRDCGIRYIITVNALKEGWDCPFAYILASLANKSSEVDVKQIVGRILRQPHAIRCRESALNTSYILTSSEDFHTTVTNVIDSLKNEGFSKKDFRAMIPKTLDDFPNGDSESYRGDLAEPPATDNSDPVSEKQGETDDTDYLIPDDKGAGEPTTDDSVEIIRKAAEEEEKTVDAIENGIGDEVSDVGVGGLEMYERKVKVKDDFRDSISELKIPVYVALVKSRLGTQQPRKLSRAVLTEDFDVTRCDSDVSLDLADVKIGMIDNYNSENELRYKTMEKEDRRIFNSSFKPVTDLDSPEIEKCIIQIVSALDKKFDCVSHDEMRSYVTSIIRRQDIDTINSVRKNIGTVTNLIRDKINNLIKGHCEKTFWDWQNLNKIDCTIDGVKYGRLEQSIVLKSRGDVSYAKSLYFEEESVSGLEAEILSIIDGSSNILWWHRILSGRPNEPFINGFLNHYPDFIAMTKTGAVIFIEVKGPQLENKDSMDKVEIGTTWASMAGPKFKYYMVFKKDVDSIKKAININQLSEVLEEL